MNGPDVNDDRRRLAVDPAHAGSFILLAAERDRSREWRACLRYASRARALAPESLDALRLLVRSAISLGDFDLASRTVMCVARISDPGLLLEHTCALCLSGRGEEAGTHVLAASHLELSAEERLFLANLAYSLGEPWHARAFSLVRQALALDPALIGSIGILASAPYDHCFNCADDFTNTRPISDSALGGDEEDAFQVNEIPFAAVFHDARVLPDGSILTREGEIVFDDILVVPATHAAMAKRVICTDSLRFAINAGAPVRHLLLNLPREERHVPGDALLFGGNPNFGHIVNDFLSKFRVATPPSVTPVLLSSDCHPIAMALLGALGFGADAFIKQREYEILRVDRLYVPSMAHRFPALPSEHVSWLRGLFPPRPSMAVDAPALRRRIYLSRRGAVTRQITNCSEIDPIFEEFGIEEIDVASLAWEEQLSVLQSCELIVAAAGGGSPSFFFAPADCIVIELRFPEFAAVSAQYGAVLASLGQPYRLVECERIASAAKGGVDGNLLVPPAALRAALRDKLNREGAERTGRPGALLGAAESQEP